jgi:hypothetical protein
MKQMSLSDSGFERKTKRTRKREFLDEMDLVVPWVELVALIAPHAPAPGAKGGRPPFSSASRPRRPRGQVLPFAPHSFAIWFKLYAPAAVPVQLAGSIKIEVPRFEQCIGVTMYRGQVLPFTSQRLPSCRS